VQEWTNETRRELRCLDSRGWLSLRSRRSKGHARPPW